MRERRIRVQALRNLVRLDRGVELATEIIDPSQCRMGERVLAVKMHGPLSGLEGQLNRGDAIRGVLEGDC